MKKVNIIIAVAMLATGIMLSSCENKKQLKMSPQSIEISGDLQGCFEVVDKEIVATEGTWSIWNVEMRRTDEPFPWEDDITLAKFSETYVDGRSYCRVGFGLETFGEDGNLIAKRSATATGLSGPYSGDDILDLLKLKPNETGFIRWDGTKEENVKGKITFRITSAVEMVEGEDKTTSSSSNWDELLDTYEAYENKYVSCMKKAISGDINVLSECASLMEKTEELGEQLENASGSMTTKQVNRYTRINKKMLEAAVNGFN